MKIPKFETNNELFAWLKANKDDLEYSKKSTIKHADAVLAAPIAINQKPVSADKSTSESEEQTDVIKRRVVINTTKFLDSHGDVHIDGIWNKTVKENTRIKHLQEHDMSFKSIISDKEDLKAFVKSYSWKDLGVDAEGKTQALVFDSNIRKSRNSYMFKQYDEGNVDNHSVGMLYIRLALAINSKDEDYKEEKEVWDKHYDDILNKEAAEKKGYFWAIYEAKAIEGSAVVIGSNTITPTLEPKQFTQEEETEPAAFDKAQVERFKTIINQKVL